MDLPIEDEIRMAAPTIDIDRELRAIEQYKEGKLSLGRLAEELGRPLGETIDFLTELGVPSPIAFEDYLLGFENLKRAEKENPLPEK